MPSSRQATFLALPGGKSQTEQSKALRITTRDPVRPESLQVTIPTRLRTPFYFASTEPAPHVTMAMSRDRVRWGSVLAGLLASVVAYVALLLLGLAIAVTVLQPFGDTITTNVSHYKLSAMIWGGGSILLSLYLGGFVAARAAAVDTRDTAWLSGVMVFLSSLVLFVGLVGLSIGLFFKVLGTDPVNVYIFGYSAINDPGVPGPFVNSLKPLLWGTFVVLLAGSVAAGLGGLAGCRRDKKPQIAS